MPKFSNFDSFIQSHICKAMDYNGVSNPQSIDLIKYYLNEVFDIDASSLEEPFSCFENFDNIAILNENFIKIPYTGSEKPLKGDIAVWKKDLLDKIDGHIGLCDGSEKDGDFYSYDQGWKNEHDICCRIKHSYNDLYGFLRPKNPPKGVPEITLYKEEEKKTISKKAPTKKTQTKVEVKKEEVKEINKEEIKEVKKEEIKKVKKVEEPKKVEEVKNVKEVKEVKEIKTLSKEAVSPTPKKETVLNGVRPTETVNVQTTTTKAAKQYKLIYDLKVRTGPSITYNQSLTRSLSQEERSISYKEYYAVLKRNSIITVTETKNVSEKEVWGKISSGWICLVQNGEKYAKQC